MAKQERKVLQEAAFSEDDFNTEQQAIMADLRAAWALGKELQAKLAETFRPFGPADADIVMSHKPWDKRITWLAPKEQPKAKVERPKLTLAEMLEQSKANGHAH